MKRLLFHNLAILSKTEKAAMEIPLKKGANVLSGSNDVGKSTILKALYHAMGANTPQLNNSRWKRARPIYCIHFSIGDDVYYIVRDENTFGVFNNNFAKLGHYQGIARAGGIGPFLNGLLGFNIQLPDKNDELKSLWPAFYFLPFYVDQDAGWQNTWTSFDGLQGIKSFRKSMLDYHLGIRPQLYYDGIRKRFELEKQRGVIESEIVALDVVRRNFRTRKASMKLDIDNASFQAEMDSLVESYNAVHATQQETLERLKKVRNELAEVDLEIHVLERSVAELQADYEFAAEPSFPDHVACPTCGSDFDNSIRQRFGILDDVDYCRSLIDQKRKQRLSISGEDRKIQSEYDALANDMAAIDEVLTRRRGDVTFAEVVKSEGYKDVVRSITQDVDEKEKDKSEIDVRLKEIRKALREFGDGGEIRDYYRAKMKEYLNALNVQVLEERDYSTVYKVIRENALGSDLPRALVAQYFSYLAVMLKFNKFVVAPMVVDSPFQQEQDDTNRDAITEFIFSRLLPNQQLVLATVDTDGAMADRLEARDVNVIRLESQYALLKRNKYESTREWLAPLHEATLSSD
jgi:hypothetical protein